MPTRILASSFSQLAGIVAQEVRRMPPVLPLANDPEPQQTPAGYRSETFDADEGEIKTPL